MAINSLGRNTMRMTGLSSNMDTESIVSNLLKIDQMRVDKQFKLKTKLQWKGDAYRDINAKLKTFRDTYMSALNPDKNVFYPSSFNNFKSSMLTDSKAVSITVGSNSVEGNYSIRQIEQLAEGVTIAGNNAVKPTVGTGDDKESFRLGMSLEEAIDKGFFGDGMTADDFFDDEGMANFYINDTEIIVHREQTFHELVSRVNSEVEGVKMSYSELRNGFMFTTTATGEEAHINFSNDGANGKLGGNFFGAGGLLGIAEGENKGKDAIMHLWDNANPGQSIEVRRSTNSFTVDGIGFTLKETTADNANIKFNIERDHDATIDKIMGFVDAYNTLVEDLYGKTSEKVNRSYDPLTDEEKSLMSEKEVEKWEELAKSGQLRNDSYTTNLLSTMRAAFYTPVEAAGGLMGADIGITTSNYYSGGKITVDKDKLRAALEKNPDQVTALFTSSSTSEDGAVKNANSGIVTRIRDAMVNYTDTVTDVALASNSRQVREAEDRLDQLEDWILAQEDKYWRQFTAMETALSSLNSQSSWLSNMFSSMSTGK
ncbi:flagellar filament capping protein FliD [Eubacteriales bacterium OttesenSCG-928-M02]|nr:flagellar filament capping protein FliD [Eubacteriales bacterium OttesenSCG-928-M02]